MTLLQLLLPILAIVIITSYFTVVKCSSSASISIATSCTDGIRQNNCSLPNCRCSGEDIPGNLPPSQVPQFVFLTFDDALNHVNFPFYLELVANRVNPNGHPITLTFFVSHEYTNYSMIHHLWRHGHEVALHSITHKSPTDYWSTLDMLGWTQEINDQTKQLAYFANVPTTEIRGMRAPFLQVGGDAMFHMLQNSESLFWDCSQPVEKILWPYTNDYASAQECLIPPCAQASYPGLWTVPMVQLESDSGAACSMVDNCVPLPKTSKQAFEMLKRNFLKHYQGNRAPFGVFLHSAWLQGDAEVDIVERRRGYLKFVDYLGTLKDTYVVGISRALEWVRRPVPLEKMKNFGAFEVQVKPDKCPQSKACSYKLEQHGGWSLEKWFHSCVAECPKNYPWVGNPLGH